MTFLPREHGAYGQLAFPLLTAYAVAGVTSPALLVGGSAIAAFLAHEPLLVVAGRRGPRARREAGPRALRWLVATGGIAVAAGVAALMLAAPAARPWFLLPLAPALVVAIALALDDEKSAAGELAVALAFSSLAVPVCVAAGAPARTGVAVALASGLMPCSTHRARSWKARSVSAVSQLQCPKMLRSRRTRRSDRPAASTSAWYFRVCR
jgi:hypothetical protein